MLTRAINDLIAVAHGMNPASPLTPIQAMMKLQQIDQQLKQGKHPDDVAKSTVLDQTIQGIQSALTPQVAQAPQGMPMPPQGGGAPQGMPMPPQGGGAPQGMPMPPQAGPLQIQPVPQQQTAQQQLPPQQPPMPMAHGGITHIPSNLHFKDGGIIAFAAPTPDNNSSLVTDPDPTQAPAPAPTEAPLTAPSDALGNVQMFRNLALQQAQAPMPSSHVQTQDQYIKTLPEWAQKAYNAVPGEDLMKSQQEISELQNKQIQSQQQNLAQNSGLPALFKALTRAGKPTGQRGLGAFLGELGDAIEQGQKERFAVDQGIQTAQIKNKTDFRDIAQKVYEMQKAAAEGRLGDKKALDLELDKIAKDYNVSKNQLIEKALTANAEILKGQTTAEAAIKAAKLRSQGTVGAATITAGKETDFVKLANAKAKLAADPTNETLQKQVTAMEDAAKLMKNQPAETNAASKENIAIDKAVEAVRDTLAYKKANPTQKNEMLNEARQVALDNLKYASQHTETPKPVPAPAPAPSAPPSIASIKGAPPGSTIGKLTPQGWEVLDKNGKILGHAKQ
jgi:hypothetical protein